ncbi:MAG: beta-galactosidase [Tannerella sp.]|jgi:beta-galactosidase/beta-glucuronidase|nr:beta-galactosidase [Tannerella sp.]
MKKLSLAICVSLLTLSANAQWSPAGEKLKTEWADKVNPQNVLPEYPRPLIERSQWSNLNGLWDYAVTPRGAAEPAAFDGKILVPFAIESSLSGVMKEVGDENELWYKREFTIPSDWKGKNVALNFGAVDWKADVFINDILIGSHKGGFTPFSFDITPFLAGKSKHKLVVRVWDPTNKGFQPRGKQVNRPEGIWYTPVTGIWQTVWLEPVSANHITAVKTIPCIESGSLNITVSTSKCNTNDIVEVKLIDKGQVIATAKGLAGNELRLSVKNPTLWDTQNPYLYDMKVSVTSSGRITDEVKSYAAFRKISTKRDANGLMRMQLNDKDLFHYGPLDQGWWPDGLYTAPTDEALHYDIKKTKDWGFNMIRKHVKVEPARWYYHCDKEGILVWQDMPSGDMGNQWAPHQYNGGTDKKRTQESIDNFYREWKEIMDLCISNPSVVVWVPFNEGWGQFDTEKTAEWTKTYDPSRLVNPASGGNHRPCGDILDLHNYPGPRMFLFDAERVNVLGEYGGIGLALDNHLWWNKRNWGYIQFKNENEVTAEYVKYAQELQEMVKRGFSGAVYTQTTDVEGEVNGLMTYDRKKIKINEADVRKANQAVINELNK